MSSCEQTGPLIKLLYEEHLMNIIADFSNWRIDPFIRQMEAERRRGRVLPFVRGLRLSAKLIYTIREVLEGTGLTANWGHLIDERGTFCSCECDVIIHHGQYIRRWNGSQNPVMDFRFIEHKQAVAVISCKSYIRSSDIDEEYCKLMEPFVKRIWLFAECCGPRSESSIQSKAFRLGYEKFWHLYFWSKKTDPVPNRTGWNEFIKTIKNLT